MNHHSLKLKTDKARLPGLITLLLWFAASPLLYGASCPHCGREYGNIDSRDSARWANIRAAHEQSCSSRTLPPPPPPDNRIQEGLQEIKQLVNELNRTQDEDPRELELLTRSKVILENLLKINPSLRDCARLLDDIEKGIRHWHEAVETAAAVARQKATGRALTIQAIRTQLNTGINRAEKEYLAQQLTRMTAPVTSTVVDTRLDNEPRRKSIGIVTQFSGEVWAARTTAPYFDSSVVDLRDAGTLTVDPRRIRGIVERKPRDRDRQVAALWKELHTLPPDEILDIFLPESEEFKRLEFARLKADMMTLPPDDQLALLFPERSEAAEMAFERMDASDTDIPDLDPRVFEKLARTLAAEEMDQAFRTEFRRMIHAEAAADQLDEDFKALFRKELKRQWQQIGSAPATAAIPRKLESGSRLHPHDRIMLGPAAHAQIVLKDGSVLTLSEHSDFSLEQADYDPETRSAEVQGTLGQGMVRIVTGVYAQAKRARRSVRVRHAACTIRGTDLTLNHDKSGALSIQVHKGEVEYIADQDAYPKVTILAGESLKVSKEGQPRVTHAISWLGPASMSTDTRAPGIQLLELILSPEGLSPWAFLGKYVLLLLGLAALFGWVWSARLRILSTMIGSAGLGVILVIGACLVSHYFG